MALYTDAFTDVGGTSLVTHGWTRTGADSLNIATSGTALGINGGATTTWTIHTPPTQPTSADHYAQGVIIVAGTSWLPIGVRVNTTNKTGYFARRTSTNIVLFRGNNGTLTQLGTWAGGSASTVIKLTATGNNLEVFADGVSVIGPVTDTTYPSDTGVGILTRGGTATNGDSFDSWESAEIAAAGKTLQAALTAAASVTSGLGLTVPLGTAMTGAASLTPSLGLAKGFAAALSASSAFSAGVGLGVPLGAAVGASGALSGSVALAVSLSASAASVATVTATIGAAVPITPTHVRVYVLAPRIRAFTVPIVTRRFALAPKLRAFILGKNT